MNTTKLIAWLTAITVAIIAVLSFTLSYAALYEMALNNGYSVALAMIWPLLIDAPLVVFSLATVNAYLRNESTVKQWILVGVYTLLTIFFNALHAPIGDIIPDSIITIMPLIVAIIAPISLFFSFELLMQQLKNSVKRSELYKSIKDLEEKLKVKLLEYETAIKEAQENYNQSVENYTRDYNSTKISKEETIADLDTIIESKQTELNQLQEAIESLQMSDVDKRRADMIEYLKRHPETNADDLAIRYNVSTQTIYKDWRELKEKSVLHRGESNQWVVSLNGNLI